MTPQRYSNPVLEELYKSACEKFGEEVFREACERARKKLDEQTCSPAECSCLSEIKEDADLLIEAPERSDCNSSNNG